MATRKRAGSGADEPAPKRARRAWPDAMPFVLYEDDAFSVNPQAVEFLQSLDRTKLAIAALAGPYRSGKSFLLERVLLQREAGATGFAIGDTVNACTKGLHISTKLLPASNSTDGDYSILVVDVEGLGAISASDTHDSRIFCMALLLSSLFLYNSTGKIDQQAVNQLHMVANLSQHIRTSSSDDAADSDDDLSSYMPSLLWILRDFHLALQTSDGKPMSTDQYLESALAPHPGAPADKNEVRASLSRHFRHRSCVALPRPVADDAQLRELSTLPLTDLTAEFQTQAAQLRERVLAQARPKRACGGAAVTGALLARLASIYCEAINAGAAPAIKDAWALISGDECRRAYDAACEAFARVLRVDHGVTADAAAVEAAADAPALERLFVQQPQLEAAITAAFNAAATAYKQRAIGGLADEFRDRLREHVGQAAERARAVNRQVAARVAALMVHELGRAMEDDDDDAGASDMAGCAALYQQAEARFVQAMGRDPQGLAAWHGKIVEHVWHWCAHKTTSMARRGAEAEAKLAVLERQEAHWQRAVETSQAKAEQTEARLASAEEELERAREAASASAEATQRLRAEVDAHAAELEDVTTRHQQATGDLREQLDQATGAQAALAAEHAALHARVSAAELRADDADHRNAQLHEDNKRLQAANAALLKHEQAAREQQRDIEALRRKVLDLTAQLDRSAEDHTQAISTLRAQTQTTMTQLTRRRDEAVQAAQQAQQALKTLQHDHARLTALHSSKVADLTRQHQAAAQELEALRATAADAQRQARDELSAQRKDHAQAVKDFQRQLDETAAAHREHNRKQSQKAREDQERLFQEKVTAASRAQTAEQRAQHAEDLLKDARRTLAEERDKVRQLNYAGRVSELEGELGTARTRTELLEQSLQQKAEVVAEQQAHLTELETELRGIRQKHEAEIMKLELALTAARTAT